MSDTEQHEQSRHQEPRFGRLLAVCVAVVVFCGVLVWFSSTYLEDCCSFDFLSRLVR